MIRMDLRRVAAVVTLCCGLFARGAHAQDGANDYSGARFLKALERGAVWCVDYRHSDQSCAFILQRSAAALVSSEPVLEASGLMLLELHDGAVLKVSQRFRYFVRGEKVCVSGDSVRREDVRVYEPATDAAFVARGDQRAAPKREQRFRDIIVQIWSADELICWSYRLEERAPDLPGPELAMTRYRADGAGVDALFGAFFETDAAKLLRLRP